MTTTTDHGVPPAATDPLDAEAAGWLIGEAMSYTAVGALRTFAELGIADHLQEPSTVTALAAGTGTDEGYLLRILRTVARRGVVQVDATSTVRLLPRGRALASDSPHSLRKYVIAVTSPWQWNTVQSMTDTVRAGHNHFAEQFGAPFFDVVGADPASAALFHDGMEELSRASIGLALDAVEFPQDAVVVDVGGGRGGLLLEALRRRPDLRGVLFDREEVLSTHRLRELAQDDRWETVAGDFFSDVPVGDVYVLQYVLHDWTDEECARILARIAARMQPGGRLLVIDPTVTATPALEDGHDASQLMDLVMMNTQTGRERTETEVQALVEGAGLRWRGCTQLAAPLAVTVAEAP